MIRCRDASLRTTVVSLIVVCLLAPGPASAGWFDKVKDPEDGQLDLSEWMLGGGGFLPMPIVITEPAVGGLGLGVAPAWFHDFNTPKDATDAERNESQRKHPQSVTAAVGLYTLNNSWLVGAAHMGSYKQDTLRYTGAIGYADFNLDLYLVDQPLGFEIQGIFMLQELKFRVAESKWFLGGEYSLLDAKVAFDLDLGLPEIDTQDFRSRDAGVGVVGYYDSRDSFYTPDTGQLADITLTRYDTAVGGDFDYWRLDLSLASFHKVKRRWVQGWRVRGAGVDEGAPFYGLPFIQMRGIPAMRYQGDQVGQVETETRWAVDGRWSVIGFIGYGKTRTDIDPLDTDERILAAGTGFRYLLARAIGLHMGIDIARGPEVWAYYFQAGHAWGI
jgi:hypothetical protein